MTDNLLTITQRYPPPPWDEAANRIRSFASSSKEEQLKIVVWCVRNSTPISVDWGKNWTYSRARPFDLVEERPTNVADLVWAPEGVAAEGRANSPGQSLMYLGDRDGTALAEVNLENQFAVVSHYQISNSAGVRVVPIGEFTSIYRSGRGPFLQGFSDTVTGMINACDHEEAQAMLLIDSFLSDTMADQNLAYEITTTLAREMFEKQPEATAIAYPSVKRRGGMNLAVKPEGFWNDWSLVRAYFGEFDSPGAAMYKTTNKMSVTGIFADGRLRWGELEEDVRSRNLLDPFSPHPDYPIRELTHGIGTIT